MRRLKTYLRSTMSTERLNSVMTLYVHKDLLDCIDDSAVVKDFVACNEVRKDIFRKGLNFPAPMDIQIQWPKCFQLQEGFAPWPPNQELCLWTPLRALPQTPVIGSCSALAMVPPNHWHLPRPIGTQCKLRITHHKQHGFHTATYTQTDSLDRRRSLMSSIVLFNRESSPEIRSVAWYIL